MIRLALSKGRDLETAVAIFGAVNVNLSNLEKNGRRLQVRLPDEGLDILILKDWDLPLYIEHGVADFGVVGSDVLEEVDADLLVLERFKRGRCRLSLIGRHDLPPPGHQVQLATKYPHTAHRMLENQSWGAEVLKLSGAVEQAPLLDLADLALDIVRTTDLLRAYGLEELEKVKDVALCFVANRVSYQRHRRRINELIERLESAGELE